MEFQMKVPVFILGWLTLVFPLSVVQCQPKPDRVQDGLLGAVKSVEDFNPPGKCKDWNSLNDAGTRSLVTYDQEGTKTSEGPASGCCSCRTIFRRQEPNSLMAYQTVNGCGDMPLTFPVYKLVREYDSAGNLSKEKTIQKDLLVATVEYTWDKKGRIMKKKRTYHAHLFSHYSTLTVVGPFIPTTVEEVDEYGDGKFPKKVIFLREGKVTGSYSYKYKYDRMGNWVQRIGVFHNPTRPERLLGVECRKITYF
jgi:hypothetical protein